MVHCADVHFVSADELLFVSVAVHSKDLHFEIAGLLRRRVFPPALVRPHVTLVNGIRLRADRYQLRNEWSQRPYHLLQRRV